MLSSLNIDPILHITLTLGKFSSWLLIVPYKTVMLTIVDCFFQSQTLHSSSQSPTACKTANLLIDQFFSMASPCKSFLKSISLSVKPSNHLWAWLPPTDNCVKECVNQDLEVALHYIYTQNTACWKMQLFWVEYPHSPLTSTSTSMAPFECSLEFQHLLFLGHKDAIAVPSVPAHIHRYNIIYNKVWRDAHMALLCWLQPE